MAVLTEAQIAAKVLQLCGGAKNIVNASNCMTRLRLIVVDAKKVNVPEIKKIMGVLSVLEDGTSIQVVLGPGKARKVQEEFNNLINIALAEVDKVLDVVPEEPPLTGNAFTKFFKRIGRGFKHIKWRKGFKHIGNIFSPLVPGFIAFGIFYSLACIVQIIAAGGDPTVPIEQLGKTAYIFYWLFLALGKGFLAFLAVFVGINAAKEFKVTPVIGGIIGGISIFPDLFKIAEKLGWIVSKQGTTIHYIMEAGTGGVLGVILAVFLIGYLERFIRKHMPDVLDNVLSPFLTILIGGVIFIFAIMPVMGYVTKGITMGMEFIGSSSIHWAGRAVIGFVLGAFFLPLVMLGLHRGLDAFYLELMAKNPFKGISIYPVFAMADASQAGAGIALWLKGKKYKHERVRQNAGAGIIPQVLGVSEPLIYGVTLPLVKPFITIGIGAGIGGAFIMAMGVGSSAFAVSGLMAIPMMIFLNGVKNPMAMLIYVAGWAIAVVSGFIATWLMISEKDLLKMPKD